MTASTADTALKPGDLVYRVIEVDLPDSVKHTWEVGHVVIEKASDRQVKLKTNFRGLDRKQFKPDALGRSFFETPQQAIQAFLELQRLAIESLDRKRKEAERAVAWVAWAVSQEGAQP